MFRLMYLSLLPAMEGASCGTVLASCQPSTLVVRLYCVSDLSSYAGSDLSQPVNISCSFDTRPPMLDRTDFASWQQRIRLYCRGKENGVNILKSIDEGPFQMGTFRETLAEGTKGALHLDIYTLINHYTDAKDIWDNVKMLLEGSELTKEDRESQLYDDFEHFSQNKGETIHDYYVRFAKLINDMRNIKMTMSRMQLNSKFVNNMLPEWGRFVTAVKLNRGLRDSNYDQLYAYLKQHEVHANEGKMMLDRLTQHTVDPLALMSNVSHQQTSSNTRNQATVQDGRVVVQNVQGRENRGQGNNARGTDVAGNGGAQNRVGNANPGQARQIKCYNCNGIDHITRNCTQPKRPHNSDYFKDKMLLMQAQENGMALDEEQLLFIAGGQDTVVDEDVDEQPVQDLALNVDNIFQVDDCDAFDSDVDESPTAQTMFMANLSSTKLVYDKARPSHDSDILSEVHDHDNYQDAICEHHEVHEMHDDVQPNYVVDSHADYTSDSNMILYDHENHVVNASLTAELVRYKEQIELYERRVKFKLNEREQKIEEQLRIMITDHNIQEENLKKELHSVKMQLNSTINHNKSMVEEVTSLKTDFSQKENKYLEEFLDMKALKEKVEDRLFKQDESVQTVHMLCKPKLFYDKINRVAIGYKNPLYLSKAKQVQPALYNGHEIVKPNHDRALAKALNAKAKSANPNRALTVYHPNTPAKLVPKRITLTGLTEGERGFEQTKACYLTEVIPFFKTIKEHFEGIQTALVQEIKEMKEVFEQMEAEVDQHVIDKKCDQIERKNLLIENENLIADCLSKDVFYTATDYVLTVSRFSDMHDAFTAAQKHLILDLKALDAQNKDLNPKVNALHDLNERFRAENEKVKQHYKELYDSIKITRAQTIKKTNSLLTEIANLKAQIRGKSNCVTMPTIPPKVLAPGMYAIDVEPIPPHNRNNREVYLDYLRHLKESVATLRKIVEEARVEKPLDSSLASACLYTKHSQELLEYVIGTCPKDFSKRDKQIASTSATRKKQVTFMTPSETSTNNTHSHVKQQNMNKTNEHVIPSTGVKGATLASGSKPRSNTKKDRTLPAKSDMKKVEVHPRENKPSVKRKNRVDSSISYKRTVINSNSNSVYKTCHQWRPTGRKFTLGEQCPLTRITLSKVVPVKQVTPPLDNLVVHIVLWYLDSGCSKHMTGDRSRLKNFVKKFIGTFRFGNDHFGAIMGYGDYVIGDSVISRVYYMEGLGHNVFYVGQFCDSDLEVAFRKHSCYVRDTYGVELIKRSCGSNLYTISIEYIMKSSSICLLSKASKHKSWLWHRLFNHLNFGTINDLARKDLVRGLPRLKFEKDHLCSACQLEKSKKHTHKPKAENTIIEVKFLRSKDETPEFIIKFLKQIQVGLNKTVRYIRTDNGTKFVNHILTEYYESVGIFHQKSIPRTPQQNGVIEIQNRTLLVHDKKPDLTFLRVFGALCYPTNDSHDLEKLQPTTDIGIFVGYAPSQKGYRIYNKRTRRIMETIHVQFDELSEPMAPVQLSTGPAPTFMTPGQISSGLVPNSVPASPYVPPITKELEILFQPMFDEYLDPLRVERLVPSATIIHVPIISVSSPSSTTIDQDALIVVVLYTY
ncbi:retrovirus-related pol polyprotein from transposon TNT 1-94 [Tanacetum coccineum]